MYEIKASTRRVTQYVTDEAYKWLFTKINEGAYSTNRCKEGKALLLQIQEAGEVTPETYQAFLDLFDNSPFSYMLYRSKRKKQTIITTDNLYCYFVLFNEHILPLGFLADFFEDDYETAQEIEALIKQFGENEKSELSIKWKRVLLDKENAVDEIKAEYPSMLKPHPVQLITQLFKIAITGGLIYLLFSCLQSIDFFNVMETFMITNKFDPDKVITATRTISDYCVDMMWFVRKGGTFTIGEYLEEFGILLGVNLVIAITLIGRIKHAISYLIYLFKVLFNMLKLVRLNACIRVFEKTSIETVGNYFVEILPEMAQRGEICDQDCAGIPKSMQLYVTVLRFNVQAMTEKLAKSVSKYLSSGFAYEPTPEGLRRSKRIWASGIIFSVIFTAIVAVIDVPYLYDLVIPKLLDLI